METAASAVRPEPALSGAEGAKLGRANSAAYGRIGFVADDPNRPPKPNALVSAARYSEVGFIIPAAVFLGYALGRLGDHWLHTHWLYLAGVIFGAVVGFAQMIRMAVALSRDKPDS